jgi:hypothetical protein
MRASEIENIEGRWLETATVENMPKGNIRWHRFPRRAAVAMVENRRVGVVRYKGPVAGVWMATVYGWVWVVTPEMKIPFMFGSKESPVKAFRSRTEAEKAIERAWKIFSRETSQDKN